MCIYVYCVCKLSKREILAERYIMAGSYNINVYTDHVTCSFIEMTMYLRTCT